MATRNKAVRWKLSVADLADAGACVVAQDQFKSLFGTEDVIWNRENYNKAMAGYIEHGVDSGADGTKYNYIRPDALVYRMMDAHGYDINNGELPDGYDWKYDSSIYNYDRHAVRVRRTNVELVWRMMEKLRKRGVHG